MTNGFDLLMACQRLDDERLRVGDKAVLCAIASFFNPKDGCAYPSLEQIQHRSCYRDRDTLIKTIKRLETFGLLKIVRFPGKGNEYRFDIQEHSSQEIPNQSGKTGLVGENRTAPVRENRTTPVGENRTQNTNRNTKRNTNISPSPDGDGVSLTPFSLTSDPPRKPAIPACPYQKVADLYNNKLGSVLPSIRFITDARKPKMKRLWEFLYKLCQCDGESEGLIAMGWYFDRVSSSSFITGQNNRLNGSTWKGDFDFLLREDVRTRLLEGSYDR